MKLRLVGHDYKYAVEQIMLALFPEERPDYSFDCDTSSSDLMSESTLSFGSTFAQATTVMRCGDKVSRGSARVGQARDWRFQPHRYRFGWVEGHQKANGTEG